jgi:hypothetical protein
MTHAVRPIVDLHVQGDLVRLRSHIAVVRSLLDELDRIVPPSRSRQPEGAPLELRAQLVEELARLGCRLLESAAALTRALPWLQIYDNRSSS